MNIIEILELRGLDISAKIKMVRHKDKRWDVHELYRAGHIDAYQSFQGRAVFDGCKYIISFLGMEKNRAKFIGVYEVKGRKASDEVELTDDLPLYQSFGGLGNYYYEMEQCPGFEDLIDRVIIDWGSGALAWHQYLTEKEVVAILPKGSGREFPGFLELVVDYDELVDIINHPVARIDWHTPLSSVAGIYLIVDGTTGKQYVGSAYGQGGILGRWAEYAKNGHGGNKKLMEMLNSDPNRVHNFRFTILQILDKSLTDEEVIGYEELYKRKLGSTEFGLNTKQELGM